MSVALGATEVVFDWTTDRCDEFDLPDSPARVVRAEDGQLVLFAIHAYSNYLLRGPDVWVPPPPDFPPAPWYVTGYLNPSSIVLGPEGIVDHNDATTNFEHPGRAPHFYYTQYHEYWLDRDLVRVPLTLKVEE